MNVLALETGSEWCSVAVGDGTRWIVRSLHAGQSHSERIVPMLDEVFAEAGMVLRDLDGIAFGAGPGAFTGVRIACGIAQGLAFGSGVPVVPVSTLAAQAEVARRVHGWTRVLAALDARMGEVYVAALRYDGDGWEEVAPPAALSPSTVMLPLAADADRQAEPWFGAGSGFSAYPELASRLALASVDATSRPDAQAIGTLALPVLRDGRGVAAALALPIYVRDRVALTTAERATGARL
jgi:tRNA threonylcarbamoyladenosine biosynthesis protein TsaB